jgi:hypothetical protein
MFGCFSLSGPSPFIPLLLPTEKQKERACHKRKAEISKLCPPQSVAFQQRQATIENQCSKLIFLSPLGDSILFVLTGQHRKQLPNEGEFNCDRVRVQASFLKGDQTVTRLPANFLSPLTLFSRELMLVYFNIAFFFFKFYVCNKKKKGRENEPMMMCHNIYFSPDSNSKPRFPTRLRKN